MNGEIVITISPDGQEIEMDGKNFEGGVCLDTMQNTINMLGGADDIKRKPEFFKQTHEGQSLKA